MNLIRHRIHITEEWISSYAQSIDAPLQTMNGKMSAPTTMPIIFWQIFEIPWLNRDVTLIHGTQRFSYQAPIIAGMILDCELSLTNVQQKEGRQGKLTLYTHELVCSHDGKLMVTAETVLIQVGDQ